MTWKITAINGKSGTIIAKSPYAGGDATAAFKGFEAKVLDVILNGGTLDTRNPSRH